jgi:hypothetical protein
MEVRLDRDHSRLGEVVQPLEQEDCDEGGPDPDAQRVPADPTRKCWSDFVFEVHVNHRTEGLYLSGLLEVPESLLHPEVNSRRVRR